MPELSGRFWQGMSWYAGLNVVAFWFWYRALDNAEFNYLMPFMTLTSLSVIIPSFLVLGERLSQTSVIGIILIVSGVLYMNYEPKKNDDSQEKKRKRDNRHGTLYFIVTAICFTITPTAAKVAIQESSVLFTSALAHLLIGMGFLVMMIVFRESKKMHSLVFNSESRKLLGAIALAGICISIENGSINTALSQSTVAYVMAIKRVMPFFAFLIGWFYFKEKSDLRKKILATTLMVLGAVLVTISG